MAFRVEELQPTGATPGARPADPRRHPRPFGAAARILVTFVAGVVVAGAILFIANSRAGSAAGAATQLSSQLVPADEALRTASSAAAESQAAFLSALESTGTTRTTALASAQAGAQSADTAWAAYLRVALKGRSERATQREYEMSKTTSRQFGAQIVATPRSSPSFGTLLAQEVSASDKAARDLAELEGLYGPLLQERSASLVQEVKAAGTPLNWIVAALAVLFAVLTGLLVVASRRDRRLMEADTERLRFAIGETEFESTLQRGLEMAHSDQALFTVARRAVQVVAGDERAQFLVADSDHGHIREAIFPQREESGCQVATPNECPAIQTGQVRVFPDSTGLDSCPYLADRPAPTCAVCVPVNVAGLVKGVLHVERRAARGIPERLQHGIMVVGRRVGERLGAIQVLARTQLRAQTDPLTGLSNRASLAELVDEHVKDEAGYVVAFADLDHFKAINDEHGHEMGDRALRLFARVLRDAIRPEDVVGRYGGEEFVVVLPECSLENARHVGSRIREALGRAVATVGLPPFTVTIGLAAAAAGDSFAEVLSRADAAMLQGKELGRDRVVTFDEVAKPAVPEAATAAATSHAGDARAGAPTAA